MRQSQNQPDTDLYKFVVNLYVEKVRYEQENFEKIIKSAFVNLFEETLLYCKFWLQTTWLCEEEDSVGCLEIFGSVDAGWKDGGRLPFDSLLEGLMLEEYVVEKEIILVHFFPAIAKAQPLSKKGLPGRETTLVNTLQEHAAKKQKPKKLLQRGDIRKLNKQKRNIENYCPPAFYFSKKDKEILHVNALFIGCRSASAETRKASRQMVEGMMDSLVQKIKAHELLGKEHLDQLLQKDIATENKACILWALVQYHDLEQRFEKLSNDSDDLVRDIAVRQHKFLYSVALTPLHNRISKLTMLEDYCLNNMHLHYLFMDVCNFSLMASSLENDSYRKLRREFSKPDGILQKTNQTVADYMGQNTDPYDFVVVNGRLLRTLYPGIHTGTAAFQNQASNLIMIDDAVAQKALNKFKKHQFDHTLVHELVHHYQKPSKILIEGGYRDFEKIMEAATEITARDICGKNASPTAAIYERYVRVLDTMLDIPFAKEAKLQFVKHLHTQTPFNQLNMLSNSLVGESNYQARKLLLFVFSDLVSSLEKKYMDDKTLQRQVVSKLLNANRLLKTPEDKHKASLLL